MSIIVTEEQGHDNLQRKDFEETLEDSETHELHPKHQPAQLKTSYTHTHTLKHCLEAFRSGLTVHTAIQHLVLEHKHGPEEARGLAMAYVVQHFKTIQVR